MNNLDTEVIIKLNQNLLNISEDINIIDQINNHIDGFSIETVKCDVITWFQQSPLHWLMGLFIIKYFHENKELSKQLLVEEINKHISVEGRKTTTTEFRYFDDCEAKGLIITSISKSDARKKKILPSERMRDSFSKWFIDYRENFIKLIHKK